MSVKTFVITIPKPLPEGAQIKGVVTPQMFTGFTTSGKTNSTTTVTSSLSSGNIKFVKQEEPPKLIEIGVKEVQEKPVRKRQKLDHLSFEEKIMRRKLKNRVAAQTARDRKKLRMDELELQVSHLNNRVTEMADMVEKLSEQNKQLEDNNKILSNRLSQCTCNTIGNKFRRKIVARRQLQQFDSEAVVAADLKAPVCGMNVKGNESAELSPVPQPRAVIPQAAVRALFLTLLCSQSQLQTPLTGKLSMLQASGEMELVTSESQPQFAVEDQQSPSSYLSEEMHNRWMSHHQPPWIMAASP